MKALILNGARRSGIATDAAQRALDELLCEKGWAVDAITLAEQKIAYCLGCFECWTKTPGLCRIDDDGRQVTTAMLASDLVVYLSPITFGGYSSELKKALDRSICLVSPFFTRIDGEVHHHARYTRYPALLGVGVLDAPNTAQEALFGRLLVRNALNLHAPRCGSCTVYTGQDADAMRSILGAALSELAAPRVVHAHKPEGIR